MCYKSFLIDRTSCSTHKSIKLKVADKFIPLCCFDDDFMNEVLNECQREEKNLPANRLMLQTDLLQQ